MREAVGMSGLPTGGGRFIVRDHGITFLSQGRWGQSHRSSRGSNAPKGEDEKVVHRAKGGRSNWSQAWGGEAV